MTTPPDGIVPPEMPEGLERVHAALGAAEEPAPDALLERIMASRAAGERRILPSEHAPPSRLRVRLVRGAIAAALGLVALGMWGRWRWSHGNAPSDADGAQIQSASFDMFGLGSSAYAQEAPGPQQPKFGPMRFDASRLRPVSTRYIRRFYYGGKQNDVDSTLTYRLVKAPDDEWLVLVGRTFTDSRLTMAFGDTLRLAGPNLIAVAESYASHNTLGESDAMQMTIGEKSAKVHTMGRYIRSQTSARHPSPDTVTLTRDTVLTIGQTTYPRLANFKSDAELLFKLMAVKLDSTWKGSVVTTYPGGLPTTDHAKAYLIPVDLEVIGTVPCTVLRKAAACWKILRTRPTWTTTFLVRKSDGLAISQRSESTVDGKKFVMDLTLIGEQ